MAADISANLYDWSTTASSNQPDGSDSLTNLDDNLRQMQAVLRGFLFSKGANIAASAEPNASITGLLHSITGTTTITGFAAATGGMWKIFKFAANPVLKHATTFNLPGATSIQAATGDYMLAVSTTSTGSWDVPFYQRATDILFDVGTAGQVLKTDGTTREWGSPLTLGTEVASTSGTAVNFTSIPSWVRRITLSLSGVSTAGTNVLIVQIGDSGGYETSGYTGSGCYVGNGIATGGVLNNTGFAVDAFASAGNTHNGVVILQHMGSNKWAFSSVTGDTTVSGNCGFGGGVKTLTGGPLDRLRLTTVGVSDTFDAGSVNILYE